MATFLGRKLHGNYEYAVACVHLFSISLGDGSVLTAYGNYSNAGSLVWWEP